MHATASLDSPPAFVVRTIVMSDDDSPKEPANRAVPAYHVVLVHPEIPYNTGSVGRTCVALGARLWLVRPLGFRLDDYYLRRAGLDYWEQLDHRVVDDWNALVAELRAPRWWFLSKKASRPYHEASFEPGDVFVFGCESAGLPDSLLAENAERCLRIPIRPAARSLNLSNAVAVVLFEAERQQLSRDQRTDEAFG